MPNLVIPQFKGGILRGEFSSPRQNVYSQSATQQYRAGTKLELPDGRCYRYSYCGTGSTRGLMQQGASTAAHPYLDYIQLAQTGYAKAVGATGTQRFLVTTGGLATSAANHLAEGTLFVATGTGINDTYRIVANSPVAETLMDVLLDEPLRTAIIVTDKVGMIPNRWYKTVVAVATTLTAAPAGVPNIDITATYWYWAQTRGPCAMYCDAGDTVVIGGRAGTPGTNATAGAAGIATATAYAFATYGTVLAIGAAGEACLVDLDID